MSNVRFQSISEIADNGSVKITCFNNLGEDGTANSSIYATKIAEDRIIIDGVRGVQGELFVLHNEGISVNMNEDGELNVHTNDDEANHYEIRDQNLNYDE